MAGDDNSISRKHIELTRKNNDYYVRDVGSKNGTMLAGKYLDDKFVSILRGNRIKVGDIFLRFE
ncbi:MAG TPA: FHA domain-containing protein [Allocoleopsis sp.]